MPKKFKLQVRPEDSLSEGKVNGLLIVSVVFLLCSVIYLVSNGCFNTASDEDTSGSSGLIPSAPTGLVVTPTSSTSITLSWVDTSDQEIGFYVERRPVTPSTYSKIATLPANTTVYTDTGRSSNSIYYYRVQAYNYAGASNYSNGAGTLTSWGTTLSDNSTPISTKDHTAIWVNNYGMITWGGYTPGAYLDSGYVYSPTVNTWTPITDTGAPPRRIEHTAIWTGSKMIIWGGEALTISGTPIYYYSGGMYDPYSDVWTPSWEGLSTPASRTGHSAIWTGQAMVIWGGYAGSYLNTGYYFDPDINFWFYVLPTESAPDSRRWHTAVWTGTGSESWRHKMIIWGGYNGAYLNSGGVYDMETSIWFSTPITATTPSARCRHQCIWTGSKMIIWGGFDGINYLNTGGIYDPAINSWTTITTTNAPVGRIDHTVVWTGNKMIVWGGGGASGLNSGAIYDPSTDSWNPTSPIGVPTQRGQHIAVWTGSEMIIWGGWDGITFFNTGGRYKAE